MIRNSAQWALLKETPEYVVIQDLYGVGRDHFQKTVTIDADAVVAAVYKQYGDKLIYYVDTQGNTDQLHHFRGKFISFKLGGPEA